MREMTEDYVKIAVDYVPVPGIGYYFVNDAKKTDALALIKKYRSLTAMKSMKAFEATDANAKKVSQILNSVYGDGEKLKNAKMKDHLATVMKAQQAIAEILPTPEARAPYSFLLTDLDGLASVATQLSTMASSEDASTKKKAMDMLEAPAFQVLQTVQKDYAFPTAADFNKAIERNNTMALKYKENRVEYDAQLDLVINFMSQTSNIN
ncbi:MAG: hypothetical protein EOP06_18130 [Proteobacteria bacterium]|nr:MAG: hypothetical protein EOP06_18130 [Pseudomonadota bacterium]